MQRVAVVTGASSGIGEATARLLAARGWRCVLIARRRERLEPLAAELGGEFEVCDVGDRGAVDRAAAAVLERHPAIKLLVNNAGITGGGGFLTADPDRIEAVTRTNYLGGVWCLRAFLPGLERGRPSDVVNVSSIAGVVAWPPGGPYSAAKHAQLAFSRATAVELRPHDIRVHTIKPTFVHTEGFPTRVRFRSALAKRLVLEADDVARAILSAVERGRVETTLPFWYAPLAVVQAAVPGLTARVLGLQARRRPLRGDVYE